MQYSRECWKLQWCIQKLTIAIVQTKVINCNSANKSYQLQQCKQKLSIAIVQTKVINCNSANKSCLFQVVHTKAIAALTQFCDFSSLDFETFVFCFICVMLCLYFVAFVFCYICFYSICTYLNFILLPHHLGYCQFAQTYHSVKQMLGNFQPMIASHLPALIILQQVFGDMTAPLLCIFVISRPVRQALLCQAQQALL